MKKLALFIALLIISLKSGALFANNLDYKDIYSKAMSKKNEKNYIFVNDTHCKLKLTIGRSGFTKVTQKDVYLEPKEMFSIPVKTGVLNNIKYVEIFDTNQAKKDHSQTESGYFTLDKTPPQYLFFIRKFRHMDWEKGKNKFAMHKVNAKDITLTKNKKSYIEDKSSWKTTVYVENNTTPDTKGFIEYNIKLPVIGYAKGTLDNGGNAKRISRGDSRDAYSYKVKYFEQKEDGVYNHIQTKESKKKLDIRWKKENKMIFQFDHKKNKLMFKLKRSK